MFSESLETLDLELNELTEDKEEGDKKLEVSAFVLINSSNSARARTAKLNVRKAPDISYARRNLVTSSLRPFGWCWNSSTRSTVNYGNICFENDKSVI